MNDDLHPSGMSWARWEDPFKTPEERRLVIKYYRECHRQEKDERAQYLMDALGPAYL